MPETTSLNILPWAHVYSQTCELYYNLLHGNKMALCTDRGSFLKELKEIQPDVLYLVPRILELVKSKIDFLDTPFINYVIPYILKKIFGKNLKTIFVGGAKLQTPTREFFKKYGITICEGYGCTELSPMVSVNHMDYPRDEESVGKILDNVLVEIIDNEIQVSGPNVMKGYWNNDIATKKALVERDNKIWYKTGDGGYVKDGFLYYTGRNNYNYKLSNGKFVNVEHVESIVKDHIKCNCVVFTKDNIHNELIASREITEELLQIINKDLNKYLKIHKAYWLKESDWEKYFTPKMSVKRKNLIQDFIDNKLDLFIIEQF
jgi:long-chain acyl-CoA synthetase